MNPTKRREFLKNSLKFGAVAGVGVLATQNLLAKENSGEKDVLVGKSKKKEVLYKASPSWEKYYSIAH